jgi:hypothetical protein
MNGYCDLPGFEALAFALIAFGQDFMTSRLPHRPEGILPPTYGTASQTPPLIVYERSLSYVPIENLIAIAVAGAHTVLPRLTIPARPRGVMPCSITVIPGKVELTVT